MVKYIELNGVRYAWRDLLKLRREQQKAYRQSAQPVLFELKVDRRPESQASADGRYSQPLLFKD